eukprot:SAG25_NODE_319_length_9948_cov_30.028328_9_plen_62_part_00
MMVASSPSQEGRAADILACFMRRTIPSSSTTKVASSLMRLAVARSSTTVCFWSDSRRTTTS